MNKRRRFKAKARRSRTWPRCVRSPFLRFRRDAFAFDWQAATLVKDLPSTALFVTSGGRGYIYDVGE